MRLAGRPSGLTAGAEHPCWGRRGPAAWPVGRDAGGAERVCELSHRRPSRHCSVAGPAVQDEAVPLLASWELTVWDSGFITRCFLSAEGLAAPSRGAKTHI